MKIAQFWNCQQVFCSFELLNYYLKIQINSDNCYSNNMDSLFYSTRFGMNRYVKLPCHTRFMNVIKQNHKIQTDIT